MKIKQISLFIENHPGQLNEILCLLSKNNINLKAIHIAETADYGVLRIICDNAEKATSILIENDYITSITPVVAVAVPDVAGGLNMVLETVSDAAINIEYVYSVFGKENGYAYMIFKVEDTDKFVKILEEKNIKVSGPDELGIE